MFRYWLACALLLVAFAACAAQECPPPPSTFSSEPNIFTPEQEMWLGEAVAAQAQRSFSVLNDAQLTEYLQRTGDRLVTHLPGNQIHYTFLLVDAPVVNAWSLPGGHVYVTRKMVLFLRNDEELAALLAHEIGHIYTHQIAIDYTHWFDRYLGVKQVGDRADVFRRYNELLDNLRRKAGERDEKRGEREQKSADQVGLYLLLRAGYRAEAMPEFFDRLAETHGKTGGFFSDFFGVTNVENRRLREMIKTAKVLPRNCVDETPPLSAERFHEWQAAVEAFSGQLQETTSDAALHKVALNPPLQTDFRQVRFSPDGKLLMVQDDSGISLLTRDPLAFQFRIPAEEARLARFSPDSRSIVFYTESLRVETWDIATRKRSAAHEMVFSHPCLESALSAGGDYFACYDGHFDLHVREVASGNDILFKKDFFRPDWMSVFLGMLQHSLNSDYSFRFMNLLFSPDGHTFVAAADRTFYAMDVTTRAERSVPGALKRRMAGQTTFLDDNSVAVVDFKDSGAYRFPSGELLQKLDLRMQGLTPATRGPYLLLRPVDTYPVGVLDTKQNKLVMGNKKTALDVYDDVFVSEARDGELALSRATASLPQMFARISLPHAQVSHFQAVGASANLDTLAYSTKDRGAVFDVETGSRALLSRGFEGLFFSEGGTVYAQFPKHEETKASIAALNIGEHAAHIVREFGEDEYGRQFGRYFVVKRPAKPKGSITRDITLEVQDVVDAHVLWSRKFPGKAPRVFVQPSNGVMTLATGMAEELDLPVEAAVWVSLVGGAQQRQTVYDLELVEANTGHNLGNVHIDSGNNSFIIRGISASREYVALADNHNRVLLFSVATGQRIGDVFGGPATLLPGGRMFVVTEDGTAELYDCATLKKLREYHFASDPVFAQGAADGKRLLVLTADQSVYLLDLP